MVTLKATFVASIDQTNLFKSCVKTLQAQRKASGLSNPSSRIFPGSKNSKNAETSTPKLSVSSAAFFLKAREVHEHISRLKQLLLDRKKIYLGRINDPASMTPEQCAIMDQILTQKLKIVEQQIADLESKIPSTTFQTLKKSIWTSPRPGSTNSSVTSSNAKLTASSETSGKNKIPKEEEKVIFDAECCMAITVFVIRSHLADLNTFYSDMKSAKQRKEDVKARLMRLHRPATVEKDSTVRLRQLQKSEKENVPETVATDNRKKVELEDWRADDDVYDVTQRSSRKPSTNSKKLKDITTSTSNSVTAENNNSVQTERKTSLRDRSSDASCERKSPVRTRSSSPASNSLDIVDREKPERQYISTDVEYDGSVLSEEENNVLEQENIMLYNELQSTHEEVRQITQQVVELGKLQDVLMESVQEQAVLADSVQELVMVATDNVQEGNEQIREAMRKDASFRVWILFFLIVMSFTILFLDWYND